MPLALPDNLLIPQHNNCTGGDRDCIIGPFISRGDEEEEKGDGMRGWSTYQ